MNNDNLIRKLRERGDNLSIQAAKKLELAFGITPESPETVVKTVCEKWGIENLKDKTPVSLEAKRVAIFVLREYNRLSLKSIAPLVDLNISNISRQYTKFKKVIDENPSALVDIKKRFNFK